MNYFNIGDGTVGFYTNKVLEYIQQNTNEDVEATGDTRLEQDLAAQQEQIIKLNKEFKEYKKETVKKLQEELNDQRRIERTNIERPSGIRESNREITEITESSEAMEQSNRSSNETIEQFREPSTRPESDGGISLRDDSTNSELDEMDSLFSLIPEGGEYSQEEIEAVKAENPVRIQRKAEYTSDSLFNLANDIDFKAVMKDVVDDIKAEKEYRSNSWKSSKKEEFQEYIKQLQKEAKKDEIVEYIINTVNETNSRTLINSLDNIYYKLVIKVITKNKPRITNTYFKNVSEFDIHHSTLEEFTIG